MAFISPVILPDGLHDTNYFVGGPDPDGVRLSDGNQAGELPSRHVIGTVLGAIQ